MSPIYPEAARQFIMAELVTRNDLDAEISALRRDIEAFRREVAAKLDTLSRRLTVRLGGLIAAGVAILAAIIKL